jgi:myo-inositol-1(or 4)-monophosphatase
LEKKGSNDMLFAETDGPSTEHGSRSTHRVADGQQHLAWLLATARKAARSAGNIQMQRFGNGKPVLVDNQAHDLKIDTDKASEAAISNVIHSQFPDHAIVAEEIGFQGNASRLIWIIDPLDGTVNYDFGLPFFCTSVACYYASEPIGDSLEFHHAYFSGHCEPLVAVIYAPFFDWMFCAATGQGASWDGLPIRNAQNLRLQDALVGISFGSRPAVIEQMGCIATVLAQHAKKVRMFGATGLDLAQVAKGNLSALVQLHVNIWDFAAAQLILAESGVLFETLPNNCNGWCSLTAPRSLLHPLKSIVGEAMSEKFVI